MTSIIPSLLAKRSIRSRRPLASELTRLSPMLEWQAHITLGALVTISYGASLRTRNCVRSARPAQLLLSLVFLFLLPLGPADAQVTIEGGYSFSAETSEVAFIYKTSRSRGFASYNWRTEKLRQLPLWVSSFSSDGKLIAGVTKEGAIAVANSFMPGDLHIIPNSKGLYRPVFASGNAALLCSSRYGLTLIDVQTGQRQVVVNRDEGFGTVLSQSAITGNQALFNAMGPVSPALIQDINKLGLSAITDSLPYRVKYGGQPYIAFRDLLIEYQSIRGRIPSSFVASQRGDVVAFLADSYTKSESASLGGAWGYDVFALRRGAVSRITYLNAYMSYLAISVDGSTVVVGIHPSPATAYQQRWYQRTFEPWLVDVRTGQATNLNLPVRVANDPAFR